VHTNVVEFVKSKYYAYKKKGKDVKEIMKLLKDDLGDFLRKEVGRQPMVIPMFVYITKETNGNKSDDQLKKEVNMDTTVGMTLEEQGAE
jgi:hypothetical protein